MAENECEIGTTMHIHGGRGWVWVQIYNMRTHLTSEEARRAARQLLAHADAVDRYHAECQEAAHG